LSCPNLKKTKEWVAAATDNNQEDAVAVALDTVAKATAIIKEVVRATASDPKEVDRATANPKAMATVVVNNNPTETKDPKELVKVAKEALPKVAKEVPKEDKTPTVVTTPCLFSLAIWETWTNVALKTAFVAWA